MKDRKNIFELLNIPENSIVAEIGVHKGDFSESILKRFNPKELHLIDPWIYESSDGYSNAWYGGLAKGEQKEMDERYKHVVDRFKKNSNIFIHRATSIDLLHNFPDNYFDWIYIDGNHSYSFVLADIQLSFDKVKKGGYVIGDDYIETGWWGSDVIDAVNKFVSDKDVKLKIISDQFIIYV